MNAIDTNVLIYSISPDDPRQPEADALISSLSEGVLLWQVACEFVAACRKLVNSGVDANEAAAHLRDFRRLFPLVAPRVEVFERAQRLHLEARIAWWDALIIAACLDTGVTRLYTEDLPGWKPPGNLEIINPFAA